MNEIISTPSYGRLGTLNELEVEKDTFLIVQADRRQYQINDAYRHSILSALDASGKSNHVIIVGCDINIHSIAGPDMLVLKLKGLF